MLSILLFIAGVIALVGGIGLFVFTYAPFIADFFNNISSNYDFIIPVLPDWLAPWAFVPLVVAGVGILVKLL